MKIAMIGHKHVPSREGGIEIAVEELAVRLVKMGHQVDVYNRWEDFMKPSSGRRVNYKGVRLISIPTARYSFLNAFIYSVLAPLRAVVGGYDVIHFHAEGPCAMSFIPKLLHIHVVATIHGLDWQRAKWGGFATKYLLWGEKNAVRYSDAMIVLSAGHQKYFKDTYGKDSMIIPNGVDVHPYQPPDEIKTRWGLEKDNYILFLARIVPEKGLHYLIEAYKKIHTDKRLVIAGEISKHNEYIDHICDMAKEDDRILMTDFVQGRTLEELFGNCYVYILPSDVEGLSISLLEALSYGVRCLVSDIPENRAAAEDCARYFKKWNTDDLRVQLEKMLAESPFIHKKEKSIAFVTERYNWDTVAIETEKTYNHVTRRKNDNENFDS